MTRRLAPAISVVTHPLLMPTYAFVFLLNFPAYFSMVIPEEAKWKVIVLVFGMSAVAPAFLVALLAHYSRVTTIKMHQREERHFPYVVTVMCFYLAYMVMKKTGLSEIYIYLMSGVTLLAFLTLLVNLFWKISSHMVGVGGLTGLFTGISILLETYYAWMILGAVVISGLVGTARLAMGEHTPSQVYAGYLLGFFSLLVLFLVL
jgi:hypothetical protein